GHYPDARSGNKGNEPENIEVASFGGTPYLFVNSERANLVFVYDVSNPEQPVYKQTLPAGVGPEGGLAIPDRNLLVVASEKDDRGDKFRAALNIYQRSSADASYPTIESTNRVDETPIPWSALSGLAASPTDENMLYSIEDSFYGQSRIFGIDVSTTPAQLNQEVTIKDSNNIFAAISRSVLADDSVDADDATRVSVFDEADLALLINDDNSVNIDPEGIAVASDGGFWVASEGSGTQGDAGRPINSLNFIFKTDANGVIEEVITLPQSVNDIQVRFGFEGITEYNGSVYVAIQRAWG
ncbi:esterase-like activity of phytase family protein, partial [Oleiphilus sp. HI0132]